MKLWRHQQEAINFLAPLKAGGCFFEMGAGKTRVALELLQRWQPGLALVVAPKAVLPVWEREARKHMDGTFAIHVLNGTLPARSKQAEVATRKTGSILVANYEAVWREPLSSLLMRSLPSAVILDEAHRIKAPGGKASRFLAKLGKLARRRLALTGTPLPHSPLDCYALYRFLEPNIFGYSFVRFRSRYAQMGGYLMHEVVGWQNLEELNQKMYSIAVRVQSKDVLDLPETMDEVLTFKLSSKAARVYRDLEKHLLSEIESGTVTAANAMVKLLRLQQLTGGFLRPDEAERPERLDTGKAELLQSLLEDMGQEQVVVFCRFHQDLNAVQDVCDTLGLRHAELSGRRNELPLWEAYQAQILAAQVQSGSLGVDLTQSRYAIYYSTGFSLGEYTQSRARVHRPGQRQRVTYYHLVAENTIDQRIMKALEKRQDLVSFIVDDLRNTRRKCRN